ncbi:hypothetical protein ACLB1S_26570 [Escherichia coli]
MSAILFNITIHLMKAMQSFLAEATPATTELWEKVMEGIRIENATHAPVDFDTNIATTITAHDADILTSRWKKLLACKRMRR